MHLWFIVPHEVAAVNANRSDRMTTDFTLSFPSGLKCAILMVMVNLSLYKRRGVAWLLCVAFVWMASVSGASWQCLDGHPCPPGCAMLHRGNPQDAKGASSLPSCCVSQDRPDVGAAHCSLCATVRSNHPRVQERCTSPHCVLRVNAKPDVNTSAHLHFAVDTTTVPLPTPLYLVVPEATDSLTFSSSRAPPERVVIRLSSPRAPPVWLI
jgi:hypothetical protein